MVKRTKTSREARQARERFLSWKRQYGPEEVTIRTVRDLVARYPDIHLHGGVAAGTPVAVGFRPGGGLEERPVESLRPGDTVLGWDPEAAALVTQLVREVVACDAMPELRALTAVGRKRPLVCNRYTFLLGHMADGRPAEATCFGPDVPPRPFPAFAMRLRCQAVQMLTREQGRYYIDRVVFDGISMLEQGTHWHQTAAPDGRLYAPVADPLGTFIADHFILRDARPFPPPAPLGQGGPATSGSSSSGAENGVPCG